MRWLIAALLIGLAASFIVEALGFRDYGRGQKATLGRQFSFSFDRPDPRPPAGTESPTTYSGSDLEIVSRANTRDEISANLCTSELPAASAAERRAFLELAHGVWRESLSAATAERNSRGRDQVFQSGFVLDKTAGAFFPAKVFVQERNQFSGDPSNQDFYQTVSHQAQAHSRAMIVGQLNEDGFRTLRVEFESDSMNPLCAFFEIKAITDREGQELLLIREPIQNRVDPTLITTRKYVR